MTIVSLQPKIYRSYSMFGQYYIKGDVKTDCGFKDTHIFYFESRKKATTFMHDHKEYIGKSV